MNVHWHRIVAFAFVLAVVILAIVFWPELGGVFSTQHHNFRLETVAEVDDILWSMRELPRPEHGGRSG